ncbi:MAG: ATP-dependent DNA ligase [Promethearchaeota archaeon]
MSLFRGINFEELVARKGGLVAAIKYMRENMRMGLEEVSRLAKLPLFVAFVLEKGFKPSSRLPFGAFVEFYERAERARRRTTKIRALARFFEERSRGAASFPVEKVFALVTGDFGQRTFGFGNFFNSRTKFALTEAYGVSLDRVEKEWVDLGDYASVASVLAEEVGKRRRVENAGGLTAELVYEFFAHLQEVDDFKQKSALLASLLAAATPDEAFYLMQIAMGEIWWFKPELVMLAACDAFGLDLGLMNHAYQRVGLAKALQVGATKGNRGLQAIRLVPMMIVLPQLAEATTLKEVLEERKFSFPLYVETKYDGMRGIFHKDARGRYLIQSRRGVDRTDMFPELVKVLQRIPAKSFILDGEIVAHRPERSGQPGGLLMWNHLMTRLKFYRGSGRRKEPLSDGGAWRVDEGPPKVAVTARFFDVLYVNGRDLTTLPLEQRLRVLRKIVPAELRVRSRLCQTPEDLRRTFDLTLARGLEGLMVKFLTGRYVLRERTRNWLKLKPERENLDVVVLGGKYGSRGRHFIRTYLVGLRDEQHSGRVVPIGTVSNVNESESLELTEAVKQLATRQMPNGVLTRPEIVLEISFTSVLRHDKDERERWRPSFPGVDFSGSPPFTLRNPFVLRVRYDKSVEEANTTGDLEKIFDAQQERVKGREELLALEELD